VTAGPMGAMLEEAIRVMLREVVREVVREEVRAALRECLTERTEQPAALGGALLTVREVAADLRVTEPTVREWIKSGELPARRLGVRGQQRLLRITRDAVDEFKRRRSSDGDGGGESVEEQAMAIVSGIRVKGRRREGAER
jgi:excisionase family DNA binding protein